MWWLIAGMAGCAVDEPSGDADPEDSATVRWTHDSGGMLPIAGSAEIVTRPDLVTWLGFDVTLDGVASAQLTCTAPAVPDEVLSMDVEPGLHGLHGLLAATDYTCGMEAEGRQLWSTSVTTAALPEALPVLELSVQGEGDMARGFTVLNHWRGGERVQRALVIDGQGRIRWYLDTTAPTGGVAVTWTGEHILAGGGRGLPPTLFTLDGDVDFQSPPPPVGQVHHHEARQTELGLLGVAGIGQDRDDGREAIGVLVEVVDPLTDALTYRYATPDHAGDWPIPAEASADAFHVNAVLWGDDGTLWLSARAIDTIAIVDRATAQVVHRLGAEQGTVELQDASGAPLPLDQWFYGQHAPEVEGDRLLVFDNGGGRPGGLRQTRIVEYTFDFEAGWLRQQWQWTESGWFEPNYGDVDRLPSGRILVASGHSPDGENDPRRAFLAEVDPSTLEVVHRLDFVHPQDSLYRAQVVDGCALFHHAGLCPAR